VRIEVTPEDFRVQVAIAVHQALRATPWTLLSGAEKGRRPRDEEEARTKRLAELVVAQLLLGVTFSPPPPSGPPASETQR
jgi:hypothetical protein